MYHDDLRLIIPDEEAAIAFMQNHDIVPKARRCPNDHNKMILFFAAEQTNWLCPVETCRREIDVKAGTWLENWEPTLRTFVHFIFYWRAELACPKVSVDILNISQDTHVECMNRLREVCLWRLEQESVALIGGEGMKVDIDESLIVGPHRQQWIFAAFCRQTNECFAVRIPERSAEIIMPMIEERIRPGSIIISDRWRAFTRENVALRYDHVDPSKFRKFDPEYQFWNSFNWREKLKRRSPNDFINSFIVEFIWKSRLKNCDSFTAIFEDISLSIDP